MGAKRVKAVVFQGDRRRDIHDREGLNAYALEFARQGKDNPGAKAYKALGTTQMVAVMNAAQAFPARYWAQGTCDHWERISGQTLHRDHDVQPSACLKCFMACGRMATITKGRHRGLKIEGPEYETIYAFGGLCLVDQIEEIAYLNDICDRLGLDTITAGNLCAFAIEATLQGRIQYPIAYGDVDGIAGLLNDIAGRVGIGDVLAEGIVPASRAWGLEDLAVHVKGMEPAGYDPRVLKGMGLSYAVSDRGACHLRTTFYKPELAGLIPPEAVDKKAELLIDFENRLTVFDALILCRFYRDMYPWEELSRVVHLTTGLDVSPASLKDTAEQIATLVRRFNIREGLTPADDRLPARLHREALPSGHSISEADLDYMLLDYYRLHGWDEEGRPPV